MCRVEVVVFATNSLRRPGAIAKQPGGYAGALLRLARKRQCLQPGRGLATPRYIALAMGFASPMDGVRSATPDVLPYAWGDGTEHDSAGNRREHYGRSNRDKGVRE